MLGKKIIYGISVGILIIICMSGMRPKENEELKNLLGTTIENMPTKFDYIQKEPGIYLEKNDRMQITSIKILKKGYNVYGIAVGDNINKIRNVFSNEMIEEDRYHIKINRGRDNHFGIVTEQLIFIFDKDQCVQEIRLGYTTSFTHKELLKSNAEVYEVLKDAWVSENNRVLAFNNGNLNDSMMDALWDTQYYQVLKPTQILITRTKEQITEKVKMNLWIAEDTVYLYATDEQGVPILESIDTFTKKK